MGGPDRDRPSPITGVVIGLAVIALIGVFVRSDATIATLPEPTSSTAAPTPAPTPTPTPTPRFTSTEVPALDPALRRVEGTWTTDLPDAPIEVPTIHLGVWTGEELIVGFEQEVAAFDPMARAWRSLPAHPDGFFDGRVVVHAEGHLDADDEWDDVVLVVGREEVCVTACARVHFLDPRAGTWTELPAPPAGTPTVDAAVWTGSSLILLWRSPAVPQTSGTADQAVGGAELDWATKSWRFLPPLVVDEPVIGGSRPGEPFVTLDAVWAGDRLLVWGAGSRTSSIAATLSGDDTWQLSPFPGLIAPTAAVWTPRGDLVLAGLTDGEDPWFGSVRPVVRRWEPLPSLPGIEDPRTTLAEWAATTAGERVLFYGGYAHSAFLAWDPVRYEWAVLNPNQARANAVAAWTGSEFVIWGGYTKTGPDVDVAIWRPPPGW